MTSQRCLNSLTERLSYSFRSLESIKQEASLFPIAFCTSERVMLANRDPHSRGKHSGKLEAASRIRSFQTALTHLTDQLLWPSETRAPARSGLCPEPQEGFRVRRGTHAYTFKCCLLLVLPFRPSAPESQPEGRESRSPGGSGLCGGTKWSGSLAARVLPSPPRWRPLPGVLPAVGHGFATRPLRGLWASLGKARRFRGGTKGKRSWILISSVLANICNGGFIC